MIKSYLSNVLASRLTKRKGCLMKRGIFLLVIILGILANALVICDIPTSGWPLGQTTSVRYPPGQVVFVRWNLALGCADPWITTLTVLIALAMPIHMAYVAAMLTVNYVRSTEYPLVCVTAISDNKILGGFLLAVLYRCRAILVLLGLLVLRLVLILHFIVPWPGSPGLISVHNSSYTISPELIKVLTSVGKAVLIYVGLLGGWLLAATLGVWLGVWWRRIAVVAPVILAAIMSLEVLFCYYAVMASANSTLVGFWIKIAPFALGAYVTAFGCWRLAKYWVRR